jgi:hypothetical protein
VGELLARAFSEQALLDAWDDVRAAALEDGVAGTEVDRFEASTGLLDRPLRNAVFARGCMYRSRPRFGSTGR